MMTKILSFLTILFFALSANAMEMENGTVSTLGALNKITGKNTSIEVLVGESASFGSLNIDVLACQVASPLEAPESAVYLKIKDKKEDVFAGWMYASSPGLSAMESGIYDIWTISCKK